LESRPFFSIVLPTFNREKLLGKAVESIINQSFKNWELLIVDDGSTDNTESLISSFNDNRIKYHWQPNMGRSAARNKGISLAAGNYICFLDSDDYYLSEHLQSFLVSIQQKKHAIAIFVKGLLLEKDSIKSFVPLSEPDNGKLNFFLDNSIHSQQVCIHNEILKTEKFNPELSIGEDLELWMRIADKWPVYVNYDRTVVVCDHENRSVNKMKFNVGLEQLRSFKLIFKNNINQREKILQAKRKYLLSNVYTTIGFYYYTNQNKMLSIYYLLKALFAKPKHEQFKYRLYSVLSLIPIFNLFFKPENVMDSIVNE
jgi:glycosyltransferase involved in cell wall biosynthesis